MNEQPLENRFVPQDQDLDHWSSYLKNRLKLLLLLKCHYPLPKMANNLISFESSWKKLRSENKFAKHEKKYYQRYVLFTLINYIQKDSKVVNTHLSPILLRSFQLSSIWAGIQQKILNLT